MTKGQLSIIKSVTTKKVFIKEASMATTHTHEWVYIYTCMYVNVLYIV